LAAVVQVAPRALQTTDQTEHAVLLVRCCTPLVVVAALAQVRGEVLADQVAVLIRLEAYQTA
jgi:hypothetical protein